LRAAEDVGEDVVVMIAERMTGRRDQQQPSCQVRIKGNKDLT
jgi:hypothetical protein